MHEKANMSVKAHSPRKRKRVCTRKPTRQSRRIRQGEETCMHEKANTSIKISDEETCMHEKANTSARAHSLQVRKRVCTSSPEARKRVCTRKPTLPFKRIRLGEETCMHEKANTSVKADSLEARKRVCTRKPIRLLRRIRQRREPTRQIERIPSRQRNVYARESQHVR